MPVTLFFCYAREDEALLDKLKRHLRPLQRQGLLAVWHDRDISPGTLWEQEIHQHLTTAQIVLLLVSPDFMDSDYCYGIEMKQALERHARGETKVIPIILRPTYWQKSPLATLQALPTDGRPITSAFWHDLDTALYDVTEGISHVVEQLMNTASPLPAVAEAAQLQEDKQQEQIQPEKSTLLEFAAEALVQPPAALAPRLLKEEFLIKLYKEVEAGHITDPETIRDFAKQFELVAGDLEASQMVSFDAARAALNLYEQARKYEEQ